MRELLYEMEPICLRYELITSMAMAIEDAMRYGPNAESTYYDAQALLSTLLHENTQQMNTILQEKFKEARSA